MNALNYLIRDRVERNQRGRFYEAKLVAVDGVSSLTGPLRLELRFITDITELRGSSLLKNVDDQISEEEQRADAEWSLDKRFRFESIAFFIRSRETTVSKPEMWRVSECLENYDLSLNVTCITPVSSLHRFFR